MVAVHSVFFGEHDRKHALGDGGIGRIGRAVVKITIVAVNFEKDRAPVRFERPKVMLAVGVAA